MGVILNSGGAWYLGVKEEDAGTAAASCYLAAAVYGIYMVMCGLRIVKANSKARGRAQINDEEDHCRPDHDHFRPDHDHFRLFRRGLAR